MKTILVINTGSTSTKVAIFHDTHQVFQDNLVVPEDKLKNVRTAVDQLAFRSHAVKEWLSEKGYSVKDLDIIAARGGPLPAVKCGAYLVNQLMIDVLTYAPTTPHESALSCMIGAELAKNTNIPVIIYDCVSAVETRDIARYTGVPDIQNIVTGHILNTRRVGKQVAGRLGKTYEDCSFIIAHLGGAISISAHERGRIVDMLNSLLGPMSTQRAGRLPMDALISLCYSGKYTQSELYRKLNGNSGFKAYFGTQDARKVAELVDAGNEMAIHVTEAMAYQISKGIAEMRIATETPVDRIILTGGMANFQYVTDYIEKKVRFIAPVEIVAGEFEMEALAEGALSVLREEEIAKEYSVLPPGYTTQEEFYSFING